MENEQVQAAPQATPQEAPHTEAPRQEQHTEGPRLGLRVDGRTGRKVVEFVREEPKEEPPKVEPAPVFQKSVEPQQAEPQQGQQAAPQQAEPQQAAQLLNPQPQIQPAPQPIAQPQAPQYYTPAEMSLAMQLGQVDESKIPPAYQPQYQALKQKNAPPPKTEAELRNEFLDAVNKMAKEKALKDVGLTEDEISMGEFSDDENVRGKIDRFKAAMDINRARIINGYSENLRVQQLQAQRVNAFKAEVKGWIDQQRKAEPHFDEIGQFMVTHVNTMPYEKAVTIAPSIQRALKGQLTEQDAVVVKNFYEECRKEFYAKQNGTSTTPTPRSPSVETKGTGKEPEKQVDYAEMLREASPRDKPAIVQAWLGSMNQR